MRSFLSFIIMPLTIFYLLLVLVIVFHALKSFRSERFLILAAVFWLIVISTGFVPRAVVRSLEARYEQLNDFKINEITDSSYIIILGGGHSEDRNLSANNQLSSSALARLAEGIRIHRLLPESRLVLSGYSSNPSGIPQAVVLYRTAVLLGVDTAAMIMHTTPSNTMREAQECARKLGTSVNLILVTSDIHMPRAMMLFREAGLDPVPAPADPILKYSSGRNGFRNFLPSAINIRMFEQAVHEYAGIAWSKLGGR